MLDIDREAARLAAHLDDFEAQMRRSLRPVLVHVYSPARRGPWARFLARRRARAVTLFQESAVGRRPCVVIPVADFAVDIKAWRHELCHVLVHEVQEAGELVSCPRWLVEAFCRSPTGYSPLNHALVLGTLCRESDRLFDGQGRLRDLPPSDCESLLRKPEVAVMFYTYLCNRHAKSGASPLHTLIDLSQRILSWTPADLAASFHGFLDSMQLERPPANLSRTRVVGPPGFTMRMFPESTPVRFESMYRHWIATGNVRVFDLEYYLWRMPRCRLPPRLLDRIARCAMKDRIPGDGHRFAVSLVAFQAWWLRSWQAKDSVTRAREHVRKKRPLHPLGSVGRLLNRMVRGELLTQTEKNMLVGRRGPLIHLIYPYGIGGKDVFAVRREVARAIDGENRDPHEIFELIFAAYPLLFPKWGLSDWDGPYPDYVEKWAKEHLPDMKGAEFRLHRKASLEAAGCWRLYGWVFYGWLGRNLGRFDIKFV
ncbi:MAG: hypothetical protein D6790_18405 [Caldilineae bacterium]|nr:MAG: hypothetical protein D6790_18405 [Caldilineae bacterium]